MLWKAALIIWKIAKGILWVLNILWAVIIGFAFFGSHEPQAILIPALAISVSMAGLNFSYARVLKDGTDSQKKVVKAGQYFFAAANACILTMVYSYSAKYLADKLPLSVARVVQ